jgi:hypothetical protein
MKIVVTYTTGDWEGTYDHILCFNYESAEAWLVDFDNKLKEMKAKREEFKKLEKEWYKREPSIHKLSPERANEVMAKWYSIRPMVTYGVFTFCNYHFYTNDFIYGDSSVNLPDVFELNEWFDGVAKNQDSMIEVIDGN